MSQALSPSIFDRMLELVGRSMSTEFARELVELRADPSDQARIDELDSYAATRMMGRPKMPEAKTYVRCDEHGVLRVGSTRVMLDSVLAAFHNGHSAETIAQQYPALSLEEVYGAITYYLANQADVDHYLHNQEAVWKQWREKANTAASPVVHGCAAWSLRQGRRRDESVTVPGRSRPKRAHRRRASPPGACHQILAPARDHGMNMLPDAEILAYAAREGLLVVSHDVNTMPAAAFARLSAGGSFPGPFMKLRNRHRLRQLSTVF